MVITSCSTCGGDTKITVSTAATKVKKAKKMGEFRLTGNHVQYWPAGNSKNYHTLKWHELAEVFKEQGVFREKRMRSEEI